MTRSQTRTLAAIDPGEARDLALLIPGIPQRAHAVAEVAGW
jgi:hypothetical protein